MLLIFFGSLLLHILATVIPEATRPPCENVGNEVWKRSCYKTLSRGPVKAMKILFSKRLLRCKCFRSRKLVICCCTQGGRLAIPKVPTNRTSSELSPFPSPCYASGCAVRWWIESLDPTDVVPSKTVPMSLGPHIETYHGKATSLHFQAQLGHPLQSVSHYIYFRCALPLRLLFEKCCGFMVSKRPESSNNPLESVLTMHLQYNRSTCSEVDSNVHQIEF